MATLPDYYCIIPDNCVCCPVSGQVKAIQCSVYGMLHYHNNHILHCIIWHNALGLYALALCVNAVDFEKEIYFWDLCHTSFITIYREKLTNQKNLTPLGNKLVIAGVRPSGIMSSSTIYGMLHSCWAITNTSLELLRIYDYI